MPYVSPLATGKTTEQLIAQAKEAADLTNVADYVTDTQWIAWLNDGARELHRKVTNKFKATYYRTFDFTLTASKSVVSLPINFWRLRKLELDPGTPRRRPVRPVPFTDRATMGRGGALDIASFAPDRWYSMLGSRKIKIEPETNAAGSYRLYYTPIAKVLAPVRSLPIDDDSVSAGTGPNGENVWTVSGAEFPFEPGLPMMLFGDILTMTGSSAGNDGSRAIVDVLSAAQVLTDGLANNETFDPPKALTLATVLDPELDPFSEYVWLTAAIKSLTKEESYAQARELKEQRNLILVDLDEAVENDQGGPATIIDTDDDEDL